MLRNHGYTSANIGKLPVLPRTDGDQPDTHLDNGPDHVKISDEPDCHEDAHRAWVRRRAPDQLHDISVGLPRLLRRGTG